MKIPPAYELSRRPFPDLLSPDSKPSHPIDAALTRAESGRELVGQLMVYVARAIEEMELAEERGG
ncbi:MAG: hypothetical protein A3K18_30285 [Lentisphaerae bacterium RIFOXYA12_64_32]|nr:MAG: hypothetical protein A3K18_30285 [Lentisphaerae bacterium RIFOXYA12_64_32]